MALCTFFAPARAAQWQPDKPVTLIVPYSPGGGVDTVARFLGAELQRLWGQSVLIDNQGGADGLVGSRRAIQAKADGYTLLVQIPSLVLSKYASGFSGTDPVGELKPVTAFAKLNGVVTTGPQVPGKTMAEVIEHCKSAAKSCSMGTTENSARLRAQQLMEVLPSLVIVNYKGGGQLITDLVANRVDMAIMGYTAAIPHIKSGAIHVVMTTGRERSPVLPDVQASLESGFPAFASETWYGLFAPLDTPDPIVQGIAADVETALQSPQLRHSFAELGGVPLGNSPEEFRRMVDESAQHWGALAQRYPLQ